MANWVRYPPPPFLSVPLLESMRGGGAIPPPPSKGYLSDTCAIPHENKANGCDTHLCDTISKGYCAIWGGISHWAAKFTSSGLRKRRKTLAFLVLSLRFLEKAQGGNSDHGPRKTRTKTQTTPDSVFIGKRRNSDHGLSFWGGKTQTMV